MGARTTVIRTMRDAREHLKSHRTATALGVVNLHSRDADLEDIFLTYYRDDEDDTAVACDQTGDATEPADVAT